MSKLRNLMTADDSFYFDTIAWYYYYYLWIIICERKNVALSTQAALVVLPFTFSSLSQLLWLLSPRFSLVLRSSDFSKEQPSRFISSQKIN